MEAMYSDPLFWDVISFLLFVALPICLAAYWFSGMSAKEIDDMIFGRKEKENGREKLQRGR